MRPAARLPVAAALCAALALAACDGQDAAPPTDTPTAASTSSAPSDTATTASPAATTPETSSPSGDDAPSPVAEGVPDLDTRCELPAPEGLEVDRVTFAVPGAWQVEAGNCRFLDPTMDELPEQTEAGTALGIEVSDTAFPTAAGTEDIEGEVRHVGARSGYQAVRIRGEAAGQALRPRGEPVQLLLVDLDTGTDESGGTLVMSASPSEGADIDLAGEALDRIAGTVRVIPTATGDPEPIVITRAEGGGTPFTVTLAQEEGCVRLHAGGPADDVVDEDCDLGDLAASHGIVGTVLESGDQQVVAGLAPPLATVVESDAGTAPYGGLTTSLEGASAFAYEANTAPIDVRAIGPTGETLATATID